MKITREQLKGIVRGVMKEESEYQTFFKKALEKTGKSIPDMSDEEKKDFFNKIDSAWNAKGEKNEELTGNQHKLDVDGDGEIEASDLAKLRAGKKKDESVNEASRYLAKKDAEHLIHYLSGKKAKDVLSFIFKIYNFKSDKAKKEMAQAFIKYQVGVLYKKGLETAFFDIDKKPLDGRNLTTDGKVLKTAGIGSQQMYIHTPKGVKMVGKITGKYAQSLVQFVNKNYKSDLVESKINEEKYTVIDPRGNSLGTGLQMQAASMAKKKGGEKAGYFVVPAKNALKARRALEKFKGDFKNPKLKDMMSDLFYENKSVNEGRAFINAAKKAKAEGKTEFEFNGKTYPVTIKD